MKHSKLSVKRLSTTRWSAHYCAVKALAENFKGLVNAIEVLCNGRENVDTRGPHACCVQLHFFMISFLVLHCSRSYKTNALLLVTTEELKLATSKFTDFYDEVSETELLLEIPRLRKHLKAANVTVTDWVSLDFLKFIVEWDFTESLPNLMIALKLFTTVCVSVASCERSFSKLKLIKNYLRATMTRSRLSNLGILAIEHEAIQNINFDEVIAEFAAVKARKKKF
ncbi:unnamed protein product [Euphydryas editha]|uniref:HAT C-terminal dimerisation domain-containing protein n=1 Tax=Euphydryas editha TaxID=104508 RepID=A0AAU9TMP8_EUPED|nr:unnamed protein product [Euphydryas editha]